MIILDTNVISEFMLPAPDPTVVSWFNEHEAEEIWTTSVSIYEIHYGIEIQSAGKRRTALQQSFDRMISLLGHRTIAFEDIAAKRAADIAAHARGLGRPIDIRDTMIAGIAATQNATLATRNVKHFIDAGVTLVNPWVPLNP
jgi:predicted nucleic acid-binding protein